MVNTILQPITNSPDWHHQSWQEDNETHLSQSKTCHSIIDMTIFPTLNTHRPWSQSDQIQSPANNSDTEDMRNIPYWEAVGSFMYAVIVIWPDIAYAVSYLARFMSNPGHAHWEAVKRVIRYLKGTKDVKLILGRGGALAWEEADRQSWLGVEGYSDTDGNSQEHRHTISGYAFCIHGGDVSWNSRKQAIISLSTTESEYITMTHAAKEAIWIRMFQGEVLRPLSKPMLLYCNNQLAIAVAKDDQFHARTKHMDIRYHFIREAITQNIIEVRYCPTQHMIADIFTKALPVKTFEQFRTLLGIYVDWGGVLLFKKWAHICSPCDDRSGAKRPGLNGGAYCWCT